MQFSFSIKIKECFLCVNSLQEAIKFSPYIKKKNTETYLMYTHIFIDDTKLDGIFLFCSLLSK